jgi:hypothetical protein
MTGVRSFFSLPNRFRGGRRKIGIGAIGHDDLLWQSIYTRPDARKRIPLVPSGKQSKKRHPKMAFLVTMLIE